MKVLLIRPKPDKQTIGLQSVMICEPLELMILKNNLMKHGHAVCILDMILETKPLKYFIKKYKPDLVGITGYISHVNIIKHYAKVIKNINRNIIVAVGGVHATVCAEDFKCKHIDYTFKTASEFYSHLNITDTDDKPDRNLPQKYRKKYYYLFHKNCALIKTSYGCPYNCNFCFCRLITSYSARDIDSVLDELAMIKQQEVYIVDDDFLFDRQRLMKFYEGVKRRNINKKYLVYGRADFIASNEDIIKKLKQVGLRAVIVGIESATQQALDNYNKKTKISDNIKAVKILKKYDIEIYATVILSIDWDKSDFKTLYKFLKRLNIVFVNLQPFTPMPRTQYFDEHKNNLLIPYNEHEKWDMAHLVVKPDKLSVRQYYFEIVKLYFKLTINPKSTIYIIKKYGLKDTLKLSAGAFKITLQYLDKIRRG